MAWLQRTGKYGRLVRAPGGTVNAFLAAVVNMMVNPTGPDWTHNSNSYAYANLTFTENPWDSTTVTIGSTTWTFKNIPVGGGDVQIGGSLSVSIANLASAIGSSGEPVTPSIDGYVLTITADTIGIYGNGIYVSDSVQGASWDQTHTSYGYAEIISPRDPLSNLQYKIYCYSVNDSFCWFTPQSIDQTIAPARMFTGELTALMQGILYNNSVTTYVIGSAANLFIFQQGEHKDYDWCMICQPYIYEPNRAPQVTGITNPSAKTISNIYDETPIRVQFSGSHGLTSGDRVKFTLTTLVPLDDEWFSITVVDADEITVDGTVAAGTSTQGYATSALQVTTDTEHYVPVTGASATIVGAQGATNANGSGQAYKIDDTHFWLERSPGPSAYSNGAGEYALAGVHHGNSNRNTIAQAFFAQTCRWTLQSEGMGIRTWARSGGAYNDINEYVQVNEDEIELLYERYCYIWPIRPSRWNMNDSYWPVCTPTMMVPLSSADPEDNYEIIGDMYDALYVEDDAPIDHEDSFGGYYFQNFIWDNSGSSNTSLWLIYGEI